MSILLHVRPFIVLFLCLEAYRVFAEHIHTRCVSILADLWHAPSSKQAIGTATTGSSEAIQLGGLAMKRIWQEKRKAAGKSIHEPGYVISLTALSRISNIIYAIGPTSSWEPMLK